MRDFQAGGRSPAYGTEAMVATSHPLASLAGLDSLREGGSAMDAAITAAAVLCVVEPQSTGIGGDVFCLYSPKSGSEVLAYNGSGCAPAGVDADALQAAGHDAIDLDSPHAVTVPGAVDAWVRLAADHGRLGLERLLAPAIALAQDGAPVYPRVAYDWTRTEAKLAARPASAALFLPDGHAPVAGTTHRQPALAQTLRAIASLGRDGFYEGPVAADMVETLNAEGGVHTVEDFAAAAGAYVEPVRTNYRGYEVVECPPNGQGLVVLLMLNLLAKFDLGALDPLGPERFHLAGEVARLAYRDRNALIADPDASPVPVDHLLSASYAADLRALIAPGRRLASLPPAGTVRPEDTVYLCAVDSERNAVSFINSLFHSFGSGIVAPRSGVMLHNRGAGFSLEPAHPNRLAPGKRPLHTIIPGMLLQGGRTVMPFGVMGGHFQPVGNVHLLTNLIDYGMDPQAALDLARGFCTEEAYEVERGVPQATVGALSSLGHRVVPADEPLGGGQAIRIDWRDGVLVGGSDFRKDGCALGY
jgi:gamma-glutamyltranspeptidase/glutathione hydrolase